MEDDSPIGLGAGSLPPSPADLPEGDLLRVLERAVLGGLCFRERDLEAEPESLGELFRSALALGSLFTLGLDLEARDGSLLGELSLDLWRSVPFSAIFVAELPFGPIVQSFPVKSSCCRRRNLWVENCGKWRWVSN